MEKKERIQYKVIMLFRIITFFHLTFTLGTGFIN